jgi:hypothetical protein
MRSRVFPPLLSALSIISLIVLFAMLHPVKVRGAGHGHPGEMAGHMQMTSLRPRQPGDKARADAIVVEARKFADQYIDYRKAFADGYTIFMPEIPQDVYHFTNRGAAIETTLHFDGNRPTSLLYERVHGVKSGQPGAYKLVGVMYTAPFGFDESQLNRRVPLSIAQWHLHTNLCMPPEEKWEDVLTPKPAFGLRGSITTAPACEAAGGQFLPHIFGWMVHVYPYETDPKKIWSEGMNDEHGMQHDAMPMEMPMGMPM